MNWLSEIRLLELISPFSILAFLFLALLIAWSMYGFGIRGRNKNSVRGVAVSAAEQSAVLADKTAKIAKNIRFVALILLAGLFSALLVPPTSDRDTEENLLVQNEEFGMGTSMIVFDISGSVRHKYDYSRDFTVQLIGRFQETMQDRMRMGFAFYSDYRPYNLFMLRTPTFDLQSLADDVSKTSLRYRSNLKPEESRISLLARGTLTVPALYEAARKLRAMESNTEEISESSIILVIDIHSEMGLSLQQTIEAQAQAIEEITRAGMNVYVLSITGSISSSSNALEMLKEAVGLNHRVKIFNILGENQRAEIFDPIGLSQDIIEEIVTTIVDMEMGRHMYTEVIASPPEVVDSASSTQALATLLFFAIISFIFFSETLARSARGYGRKK